LLLPDANALLRRLPTRVRRSEISTGSLGNWR
jgi:hypothetical protein